MITYGKRLKEERERLGLTQTAMAELAGITKVTQINYEKDARKPDIEYLQRIAEVGVNILYVINGQINSPEKQSELSPEPLARDEAALLDNYRHSSDEGKQAIRTTSASLAQSGKIKKQKIA